MPRSSGARWVKDSEWIGVCAMPQRHPTKNRVTVSRRHRPRLVQTFNHSVADIFCRDSFWRHRHSQQRFLHGIGNRHTDAPRRSSGADHSSHVRQRVTSSRHAFPARQGRVCHTASSSSRPLHADYGVHLCHKTKLRAHLRRDQFHQRQIQLAPTRLPSFRRQEVQNGVEIVTHSSISDALPCRVPRSSRSTAHRRTSSAPCPHPSWGSAQEASSSIQSRRYTAHGLLQSAQPLWRQAASLHDQQTATGRASSFRRLLRCFG